MPEHKWKDIAQPATFDDPSPVATGPFVDGARVRAHGVRARPQSQLLAAGQARRGRAPRAALPQQRRHREGAGGERGGLGVPLLPRHREGMGGRGSGPPSILVSRHRPHRPPVLRHAPQAVRRPQRAQGAQHGHRSPADHEGRAQRLRAARGRDRPRRIAEALEGRGPGPRSLDAAQRRRGQQAARRGGTGAGGGRDPRGGHGADAVHLPDRAGLDGLAGGGGDPAAEPGRGRGGGDGEDASNTMRGTTRSSAGVSR